MRVSSDGCLQTSVPRAMLNVNLLTVNSLCLCGFAALKVSQPVAP